MCVSTMFVFGSKWNSHTCSSSIFRVTTRPSLRSRNSSSRNSRGCRSMLLAAAPDGARDEIHFEIAGLQHGRRRAESRAPRQRGQARHQFFEGERLDEIVVAAGLEPVDPVVDAGEIGEEEHRRRNALGPHQRDDAEPVELRQHAVEDDDVETIGGRPRKSLAAVRRDRRLMPARLQARRDEIGGSRVVFDNQNLHPVALAERRDAAIARRPSAARCGSRSPGRCRRRRRYRPMERRTACTRCSDARPARSSGSGRCLSTLSPATAPAPRPSSPHRGSARHAANEKRATRKVCHGSFPRELMRSSVPRHSSYERIRTSVFDRDQMR